MGLGNFIKNQIRINRAGRISRNKSKLEHLENKYPTYENDKKIENLKAKIAKDEERQKIYSENNSKMVNKTTNLNVNNAFNKTKSTGVNLSANINSKDKPKK